MVDTSFWSAAVATGVDAYLTDLFAVPLWMPQAVVDEVMAPNPLAPSRVYLRQQRLRAALRHGEMVVRDPVTPYWRFGRGEAACLGLAHEVGCYLLINDHRPYIEAINVLRLNVLSVPDVIAILASRGTVAIGTALAWLDLLRDTVSDALVDTVAEMLREGGSAPS